jgi:hyperosmotically inducible periplasmic protein
MKGFISTLVLGTLLAAPLGVRAQEQAQSTKQIQKGRYDDEIQQKVQDKLKNDKFKNVKADVLDQIVHLTGTVDLMADKSDADRKAHKVDKVRGVENDIQVAGKQVSDAELRDKLATRLKYDRVGYGNVFNAITLGVQNGVVTLGGEVRTDMDRDSAINEVEHTPGVKDVVEDIKVSPTSNFDDDTRIAIARAIYGRLPRYANDPGAPIRIVVDRGHVTLYGVVDSTVDKVTAEMAARSVPNVFSVDSKLMVASDLEKSNQSSKK